MRRVEKPSGASEMADGLGVVGPVIAGDGFPWTAGQLA